MDGEEGRAELRGLRRRALDRVGDVMQLEIEKDLFARRGEPADERRGRAAVGELHADLIEDRAVADPLDKPLRLADVGHVERDDQPVAGRKRVMRGPPAPQAFAGAPACVEPIGPDRAGGRLAKTGRPRRAE